MKLVSLNCTQCGARLPQQKASGTYTCSYCGAQFAAPEPAPKKQRPSQTEKAPQPSAPASRGIRFTTIFAALASILPFAIGGFVMYRSMAPMLKGSVNAVRLGSPLRALWDQVGGPPVPVQLGGHEAVLGRMRLFEDQLYIVATDSATAKPLWKVGPLGTYSDGYRNVYFAVTAQHLVVSDARGNVHIAELSSGKEVKQIPLRDRATNVCYVSPHSVAVAVLDRHHVLVDTDSLALSEADLPAGCESQRRVFREPFSSRVKKPALRGFTLHDAHAEGELAVAPAVKSPGTPTPYAIGFTSGSREVRWQTLLPTVDPLSVRGTEHDALAGGRYFAIYGVGSSNWHLTALDARQGSRLWDVELRPLFAVDQVQTLLATSQFVYVNRTSSTEIFDAASGKLIGAVGTETYR